MKPEQETEQEMNRRQFVKAGAAATFATGLGTAAHAGAAPKRPPNVLYMIADQHRAASQQGEPFSDVMAPHLAAFRNANFCMETCVSNYPLCTPHRGILMTGLWPAQSGINQNDLAMKPSEFTLTRAFKENKEHPYHVGYIGKWHLGGDPGGIPAAGSPGRFGIDDWLIWYKTIQHYDAYYYDPQTDRKVHPNAGLPEDQRVWDPVYLTRQAKQFLEQRKAEPEKPWMLFVSWNPPHPPFNPPKTYTAPYNAIESKLQFRPNVQLEPDQDQVEWIKTDTALRSQMERYYGGITGIDGEFQQVLDLLEKNGMAENTIVIYTSDHGEMLGSHGRVAKQYPYEESCRVPFMVRGPGIRKGRSDAIFASVDIFPTVCGLAGVPVPSGKVGTDYSGILRGRSHPPERESTFLLSGPGLPSQGNGDPREMDAKPLACPIYRGIRTRQYTYAVVVEGNAAGPVPGGRWLLFDNKADPYQQKNLVGEASRKPLMDSFDTQIKRWLTETNDPFLKNYPSHAQG